MGKPIERWGRKAMGLKAMKVTPMTARLLLRNDRGLPKSAVIAMLGLLPF